MLLFSLVDFNNTGFEQGQLSEQSSQVLFLKKNTSYYFSIKEFNEIFLKVKYFPFICSMNRFMVIMIMLMNTVMKA